MQSKSKWVYPFLLLCIGRGSHLGASLFLPMVTANPPRETVVRIITVTLKGGMQKAQQSPV